MKTPPIHLFFPRWIALLVALFCLQPIRGHAADSAPAKPIKGLILTGSDARNFKVDPVLAEKFAAQGISFDCRSINDPLDEASLKSYPVVIVAEWTGPFLNAFVPRKFMEEYLNSEKNMPLLVDYVAKGGGLLWIPYGGGVPGAQGTTDCLKPFGLGMEAMQVRDDAHAYIVPHDSQSPDEYAWTTQIMPHEVTKGITRIYYPMTQFRWDDIYSNPVMTFSDPAWKQVVKGMDTSVGAKGADYTKWTPHTKQPAIAAVRDYKAGRVAVFTPNYFYTLAQPYADPKRGWIFEAHTGKIDGVVVEKGDGTHPSDGLKLMVNLVKWLAQNSTAKGVGTGVPAITADLKPTPAPEWIYSWNPDNGSKWFKVLVGARSKYSDGEGTLEEYAQAAKAAGVEILAMTETFDKFTPAKWEEYREKCRKLSDDKLKIVAGLDIQDTYGAHYLLLNSPVFPWPALLDKEGRRLVNSQYLCLGFPGGTTIMHRPTTSPILNELQKDFQGMSVYTYKGGKLEDDALPAYEWQTFRLSNPLPYVVHETYSPKDIEVEATAGHQLLVSADTLADAYLYFGAHGLSHFWEAPAHFQLSAGPVITRLQPGLSITIEDDVPITEVRMMENFNLYRRWTPNSTKFSVDQVKLPDDHVNWMYFVATDAKGRTVVSPGMNFGKQIVHTWRCGDRQNWWCFSNIYTGTEVGQLSLQVPTFGTEEGKGAFPEMHGPLRGDDMTTILDFVYASPAVYIQDAYLDERYFRAVFEDVAYDAKPMAGTIRSRIYQAVVRYYRFFVDQKPGGGKNDQMPDMKDVTLSARRPLVPSGDIFPVFTTLNEKHAMVAGDMSYSYIDPKTNQEVTGTLTKGTIDLPFGGRVGGFIALSDGIRVGADKKVGWAPEAFKNGSLPTGTTWKASFVTVQADQVDKWRALMGVAGTTPYALDFTKGKLQKLAYVANCVAEDNLLTGTVKTAMPKDFVDGINTGLFDDNKEAVGRPLDEYKLPIFVDGINYNWPSFLWRDAGTFVPVDVFEGKCRARLDVMVAGPFSIGNVVLADDPNLRIGLLKWTPETCDIEVNNASDQPVKGHIHTNAAVPAKLQSEWDIDLAAGASVVLHNAKK